MGGPEPLVIHLHDTPVAQATEARTGKLTLEYSDEAHGRWALNTPVLSVSLPLRRKRYPPSVATPFLEGLLPEGESRTVLERHFDVRRGDTHGLLAAIGRDCAGAVVIRPESSPPMDRSTGAVEWMELDDLATAVDDLPSHPLGVGDEVRVSLAGQQSKLLVVRDGEGRYGMPLRGHPSTHILKPEDLRYPAMAANEAFCLRVVSGVGLTTVEPEVLEIAGRSVLVVARYDRARTPSGDVIRIHQEDLCQALAIDAAAGDTKYEAFGGPSLRDAAGVLDRFNGTAAQLTRLVEVMTATVALGNADAHGKNLSLLHTGDGRVELAPLYDVMSTIHYPSVSTPDGERPVTTDLAMRVGAKTSIHEVTFDDLVAEAASWPYASRAAADVISGVLECLPDAVAAAARATRQLPEIIPERILRRVTALAHGRAAGT